VKVLTVAPPSPRALGPAILVTLLLLTLMLRVLSRELVLVDAMLLSLLLLMSSGSVMPTVNVLGLTSTMLLRLMPRQRRTLLLPRPSQTRPSRTPLPRLLMRSVSQMLVTNLVVSSLALLPLTLAARQPILLSWPSAL
jgi:hypothetical protein